MLNRRKLMHFLWPFFPRLCSHKHALSAINLLMLGHAAAKNCRSSMMHFDPIWLSIIKSLIKIQLSEKTCFGISCHFWALSLFYNMLQTSNTNLVRDVDSISFRWCLTIFNVLESLKCRSCISVNTFFFIQFPSLFQLLTLFCYSKTFFNVL